MNYIALAILLFVTSCRTADQSLVLSQNKNQPILTETKLEWTNQNHYAPTVLYDESSKKFMMWYLDGQTNPDDIHLRVSDSLDFSDPKSDVSVLDKLKIAKMTNYPKDHFGHVGDPSVIKIDDTFIMFFTTCLKKECHDPQYAQIWSVTSKDGITWEKPVGPLSKKNNIAQPSVIKYVDNDNSKKIGLYFENRGPGMQQIWYVDIGSDRKAISEPKSVFKYTQPGVAIAGPEVMRLGDKYHLFFSSIAPNLKAIRIHHTESKDPINFGTKDFDQTILISPTEGVAPCGVETPGAIALDQKSFYLYFRQVDELFLDGSCLRYQKTKSSIQRYKYEISQ